jgi:tyrosinase
MRGSGRENDGKVMDGPFAYDIDNWQLYTVPDIEEDYNRPYLTRLLGVYEKDGKRQKWPLPASSDGLDVLKIDPYDGPKWDVNVIQSFRNNLEGFVGNSGLHNTVHIWVGGLKLKSTGETLGTLYRGTMSAGDSPNDHVFWLHHANIDRLWADWQLDQKHWDMEYKGYLPISSGPSGINVNDPMPPWFGTSPANAVNFYPLQYKYNKYYRKIPWIGN